MNEQDKELYNLINPRFEWKLGQKSFQVRKANLEQIVSYHEWYAALPNTMSTVAKDAEAVAYAIYLILKEEDEYKDITLERVRAIVPGDVDAMDTMIALGFLNPKQVKQLEEVESLQEKMIAERLASSGFSPSSPNEPISDPGK